MTVNSVMDAIQNGLIPTSTGPKIIIAHSLGENSNGVKTCKILKIRLFSSRFHH